jgi:6-phosphofructokinase 1
MARCGGASLAVIPEEFRGEADLSLVLGLIEGSIHKSAALGMGYGVAVVAEGVGELLVNELDGRPYVGITHDKSGNLRLAEVPLALILKKELQDRMAGRGQKTTVVDITIGYELRCAPPVAFDAEYVQQLGWGAVNYVLSEARGEVGAGAMVSVSAGQVVPIPFEQILDAKTGKTAIRRVDINSDVYRSARAAMIRLTPEDLAEPTMLERLAQAANLTADQFRELYRRVAAV